MKSLHAIQTDPTILDYMELRYPMFTWELDDDMFVYWDKTRPRPTNPYRDMGIEDARRDYENWIARGAPRDKLYDWQ